MGGNKIEFKIVVLVVVVSCLVIFTGQFLYQRLYVNNPLTKELKQLPEVTNLEIEENNHNAHITITLGKVKNLEKSYLEINKVVEKREGRLAKLEIIDNPNSLLEDIYREMNFSIQEGIVTGNFAEMYLKLESFAQERGLKEWSVSMDQNNIYLQMQEKDHYLYRVIPRAGSEKNVEGN